MRSNNRIVFGTEYELPYALEEAFNRLRINVNFLGNETKKIMIISSEPNEGKSFVAMNLWKQMAKAGEPVVLLDMDMRNSTLVEEYGMQREDGGEMRGMSHYLSGKEDFEEAVFHTEFGNADILPNTDNIANPSLLFESNKFEQMLAYANGHYRYVFCDTPPLGLVSDGERIGNLCDGAILCVRAGVTPKSIIKNSIAQLERAGCPLLGIVLNRSKDSKGSYYSDYYGRYGKYGKYYGK